jgi:hypothetical protein
MNTVTILKVFKNSSLITPQGEFKISRVFDNAGTANKARYRYHYTENGITIYARKGRKGKPTFAVIDD